jgi:hypothetical protein
MKVPHVQYPGWTLSSDYNVVRAVSLIRGRHTRERIGFLTGCFDLLHVGHVSINHSDLYQLLAYAITTDLPERLLIYGAGSREEIVHHMVNIGRILRVISQDLSVPPEELLQQIADLTEVIRSGEGQQVRLRPIWPKAERHPVTTTSKIATTLS